MPTVLLIGDHSGFTFIPMKDKSPLTLTFAAPKENANSGSNLQSDWQATGESNRMTFGALSNWFSSTNNV